MKGDLRSRSLITAAAIALALVATRVPLPGIPPEYARLAGDFPIPVTLPTLMSLGLEPYLFAAQLLLFLSGGIPALRRLREGPPPGQRAFDRVMLGLAMGLCVLQGQGILSVAREFLAAGGLAMDGWMTLRAILTLVLVFALSVWAAFFISRSGLGNGAVLVAFAVGYLPGLPALVRDEWRVIAASGTAALPMAELTFAAVVALGIVFVRGQKAVKLVPLERRGPGAPSQALSLPLRLNLTGIVPITAAGSILSLPTILQGLLPDSMFPRWLIPGERLHLLLFAALIVAGNFLFTAFWFDTRRVAPLLERWGFRIEGPPDVSTERRLDKMIEQQLLLSSLLLLILVLLPGVILESLTGVSLERAGVSGAAVLVACAVATDTLRHAKSLKTMEAPPDPGEDDAAEGDTGSSTEEAGSAAPAWVAAFEPDTELEGRLAVAELEGQGLRAVLVANRPSALLGTLAIWEWTVPTYPAVTIHRRLGGGKVAVKVPEDQLDHARAVLEPFLPA